MGTQICINGSHGRNLSLPLFALVISFTRLSKLDNLLLSLVRSDMPFHDFINTAKTAQTIIVIIQATVAHTWGDNFCHDLRID